jgi:hypothetical protein
VDAGVGQVRDQPFLRVRQVVAVVHPHAGAVRHEGDLVLLAVPDVEGVHDPGAAGGRLVVARQDDGVVAVQVHLAAAVGDAHAHDVALDDRVHGDVGEQPAVDRPPHARTTVDEARSAPDGVGEAAVDVVGVERQGPRAAVAEQVELLARPGSGLRAVADHDRPSRTELDAGRGRDLEVDPPARRHAHAAVLDGRRSRDLVAVVPVPACSATER